MANYVSHYQAKQDICEIGRRMYLKGFVAANDGNISIRVGKNEIWTTPTGVSKGYLKPEMLVKVNLKGEVIEGKSKPSSEVKMHLKVYEEDENIKAVTHAHPPVSTAYAIAGLTLDKALLPEAIVNLGVVPVADYATPGTKEVPDSIAKYVKGYNAVLMANHGALTWGEDIYQAYFRLETLEHYSNILLYTKLIGKAKELDCEEVGELLDIRDKLGIHGGGAPTCTPRFDDIDEKLDIKIQESPIEDDDVIDDLAAKVTENVLKLLNNS